MEQTMPRVHSAPNYSLASLVVDPDDYIYFRQMKTILESYPNTGPPRQASQLSNNIFIGSLKNADDIISLMENGITHVLNCAGTRNFDLTRSPYPINSGITDYFIIPAQDHGEYNIMSHFSDAFMFLDKCRKSGGKALVHCNLGINRSGAICASYLMLSQHMPLLEVITLLKKARGLVLCNKGFRRQLIRFARIRGYLDVPKYIPQSESIKFGTDRTNTLSISQCHSLRDERKTVSTNALNMYSTDKEFGNGHSLVNGYSNGYGEEHNSRTNWGSSYESLGNGNFVRGSSINTSSRSVGEMDHTTNNNKRPVAVSHYDKAYFMDPIPEDGRHKTRSVRESSAPPSNHYDTKKSRSISSFGEKAKAQFMKTKTRSISCDNPSNNVKASTPSSLSTTRPLRVYKRSVTDTEIYQKPSTSHTYKRADTVATSDIASGLERLSLSDKASSMPSGLSQRHRVSSRMSISSSIFNRFKSDWKKS